MRVRVGQCVVVSAPGWLPAVSSWALHAVVLLIDLSCGCILSGSPVASLLFRSGWHLTLWSLRALASASYAERGLRDGCGAAVDGKSVYFGYTVSVGLPVYACHLLVSVFSLLLRFVLFLCLVFLSRSLDLCLVASVESVCGRARALVTFCSREHTVRVRTMYSLTCWSVKVG